MSNIKWIKLSTAMFEDEKIRLIEQMPDADTILVIWVKLLAQAGKTNASGYIYLNQNIPYTEEMLATIFNRPVNTVRLALKVFQEFGMIDIDDDQYISISNWEKHQNIEGLEKIREQTRKRVAKHREKQRLQKQEKMLLVTGENENKPLNNNDETQCNVTVTENNATEEELEEELDIDKEYKDIVGQPDIPYKKIVDYLNKVAGKKYKHTTRKTKDLIKARMNEGFTFEDFIKVIDIKNDEWKNNDEMKKFIRPETLFGTKFESYLNQSSGKEPDPNNEYSNLF